jgi:ABC-type nitrate/sulfonate/bicarbonate transport system substrate-binding protein
MLKKLTTALFLLFSNVAYAQPIVFGQLGVPTIIDMIPYVAVEKGFFTKRGLDILEPTRFAGSPMTFAALMSGDAKVISASTMSAVTDRYNNAPFVIGKALTYNASYLYARPSIKSIEDLTGKTIAVGGASDITRMHAEIILESKGVTDVNWWYGNENSKRYIALKSGQLDAVILTPPFTFLAEQEGYVRLGKTNDFKLTYQKGLIFRKDWAEANSAKVRDIITSLDEAIVWLYNTNNRDEAANILVKISGVSKDEAIKSYDLAIQDKLYILEDTISKSIIDYFVSVSRKWGNIKGQEIPVEKLVLDNVKIVP